MSDQFTDQPEDEGQEYDEQELEGWFEEGSDHSTQSARLIVPSDEDKRTLPRTPYTEFAGGFQGIELEESLVLNLKTTMSFVEIQLEIVINEQYPLYTPPEEGYEYSFRQGRVFFPNVEQIRWSSRIQPNVDPGTGNVDYGSIDYLYRQGNWYYLGGFWGEMEVQCAEPLLEIPELMEYERQQHQAAKQAEQQTGNPQG